MYSASLYCWGGGIEIEGTQTFFCWFRKVSLNQFWKWLSKVLSSSPLAAPTDSSNAGSECLRCCTFLRRCAIQNIWWHNFTMCLMLRSCVLSEVHTKFPLLQRLKVNIWIHRHCILPQCNECLSSYVIVWFIHQDSIL